MKKRSRRKAGWGFGSDGTRRLISTSPKTDIRTKKASGNSSLFSCTVYPLVIRIAHSIISDWHIAALVVSNLCCAGAFIYFFLLCRLEFNQRAARRAVLFLAVLPTVLFSSRRLFGKHFHVFDHCSVLSCAASPVDALRTIRDVSYWKPHPGYCPSATAGLGILAAKRTSNGGRFAGIAYSWCWSLWEVLLTFILITVNMETPYIFWMCSAPRWGAFLRSPFPSVRGTWHAVLEAQPSQRVVNSGGVLIAFIVGTCAVIVAPFRLRPIYSLYLALSWIVIFCNNFPICSPRYLLAVFPLFTC